MKRARKWFVLAGLLLVLGLAVIICGLFLLWPDDQWVYRLPSPDGRYDVLVLRSSKAASDDFSYHLYVFPHALTPRDQVEGAFFARSPFRRGSNKHLIYSGYCTPTFHWTGPHSITLNLHEPYLWDFIFEPMKRLSDSDEPLLVSLGFSKDDPADILP